MVGGRLVLWTMMLTDCETFVFPSCAVMVIWYSPASPEVVCHVPCSSRGGVNVYVMLSPSGSVAWRFGNLTSSPSLTTFVGISAGRRGFCRGAFRGCDSVGVVFVVVLSGAGNKVSHPGGGMKCGIHATRKRRMIKTFLNMSNMQTPLYEDKRRDFKCLRWRDIEILVCIIDALNN